MAFTLRTRLRYQNTRRAPEHIVSSCYSQVGSWLSILLLCPIFLSKEEKCHVYSSRFLLRFRVPRAGAVVPEDFGVLSL